MSDLDTSTHDADADAQAADADAQAQAANADTQDGGGDGSSQSIAPEDARKLRSENRSLRQRLKDVENKLGAREAADLTEQQKLERDLSAERAAREQAETTARALRVQVSATKLGVRADAVDLVAGLVDWEAIDDPGDAKQIDRAVRELIKERPFLSGRDPEGLGGGNGRQNPAGAGDMNSIIRRAAGRA